MQAENTNLAGLVLAGGAGRRMQGLDKGLQMHRGRPLVEWVVDSMQACVSELVVSANRHHETYAQFAAHVLADSNHEDFMGPMAGICRAIEHYATESRIQGLLVSPCDTPNITPALWQSVIAEAEENPDLPVVCHDGERPQSLHCRLPRAVWPALLASYTDGNRAMHHWLRENGAVELDCSDRAAEFVNLNYLEELSG
jgi:molybdopterin-guanine dinucleotide biosynthesis protein A